MGVFTEGHALLVDTLLIGGLFLLLWYLYKLLLAPLFSPLRKIPGCPFIPIVGNMLEARKAEPMTNAIRWMKRYNSKIIRFYYFGGQERLLVADPNICRQILVTNSRNYARPTVLSIPTSSEDEDGIRSIVSGVREGEYRNHLDPALYFPTKARRKMNKDVQFTKELTEKIIRNQQNNPKSSKRDILTMLTTACDVEGTHLSKRELVDHVFGFLLAGFDTTSVALTWILLQLSERPDLQEKVRQEILSVLGEDVNKTLAHEDLDALKLTTAVIKETQRLFPVIPTLFRTALADDNLNGYHIPKGTIVGLHFGALHRLNWENPDKFDPGRFLEAESVAPMTFLPFSYGPYMCIGHKFSMMEMKTVLSVLLRKFVFQPTPGFVYRKFQSAVLKPNPPAIIRIRIRN
uniref:Cytochrome P450 4d2 n=1 Tax=Magallana gigas TaxID=29159 RepID=K1P442_MAGGI